jgi:hypothetical protein
VSILDFGILSRKFYHAQFVFVEKTGKALAREMS